jgi:hypothetical protein
MIRPVGESIVLHEPEPLIDGVTGFRMSAAGGLYPVDWPEITQRIRARDGNRCRLCGAAHQETGWHDARRKWRRLEPGQAAPAGVRVKGIVVVVAHKDNPDPADCRDENLWCLCRGCHMIYDEELHRRHAAERARAEQVRRGQLSLFDVK